MAGTFLLPWEEWIVKPLYVAMRRQVFKRRRERELFESKNWPEAEGVIHQIEFDSSLPREGLRYAYECESGYYSGLYWRWFGLDEPRKVRIGDHILLRYNAENPENSVFLNFQEVNSPVSSVLSRVEL